MRRDLPMILIRVLVGFVFLIEGILKFVQPEELGSGWFAGIGLPFPEVLGPLVGGIEITGAAAILMNIYAGDAALLLLIVVLSSLFTIKLPILLGHSMGLFQPGKLPRYGLLSFLHEARLELCLIFGSLAVLADSGLRFGRRRPWYQAREL